VACGKFRAFNDYGASDFADESDSPAQKGFIGLFVEAQPRKPRAREFFARGRADDQVEFIEFVQLQSQSIALPELLSAILEVLEIDASAVPFAIKKGLRPPTTATEDVEEAFHALTGSV
jgi:hypothetical protein